MCERVPGRSSAWRFPSLVLLASLLAAAWLGMQPRPGQPVAAVFPPWWGLTRAFAAAAAAGVRCCGAAPGRRSSSPVRPTRASPPGCTRPAPGSCSTRWRSAPAETRWSRHRDARALHSRQFARQRQQGADRPALAARAIQRGHRHAARQCVARPGARRARLRPRGHVRLVAQPGGALDTPHRRRRAGRHGVAHRGPARRPSVAARRAHVFLRRPRAALGLLRLARAAHGGRSDRAASPRAQFRAPRRRLSGRRRSRPRAAACRHRGARDGRARLAHP